MTNHRNTRSPLDRAIAGNLTRSTFAGFQLCSLALRLLRFDGYCLREKNESSL